MAISTCQNNNVFWTTYTGKFWLLVLVCTLVYLGSDCINSGNAECDFFLAYKHSENDRLEKLLSKQILGRGQHTSLLSLGIQQGRL